jgi:PelA/Pel-15E family pectate lyase
MNLPLVHLLLLSFLISVPLTHAQSRDAGIDLSDFYDSAHHWYDITDEVPKQIAPDSGQRTYSKEQVREIAENVLLFQRSNGGWPKNYDMAAVLSKQQREKLAATKDDVSLTTFDNGATHSHIEYLAKANELYPDQRYRDAVVRGIRFILSAQYSNGGFPQFYPDTSGYRKYITFNDGAMNGILKVLGRITENKPLYSFIEPELRGQVRAAYDKGISCILQCQIRVNDTLTAWCQQHDHRTLAPQNARSFEPKAICSMESADIVLMLMKIDRPNKQIVDAVNGAVSWFLRSRIFGTRVETIAAPKEKFMYHTATNDRIVVQDPSAPPIWTRMYEIHSNRPMFCRRDGTTVYTLAEVERERRTGYKWYCEEPADVLERYPKWQKKWSPDHSALGLK